MSEKGTCCCAGCCEEVLVTPYDEKDMWIAGKIRTQAGIVPVVSTEICQRQAWGVEGALGHRQNELQGQPRPLCRGRPRKLPVLVRRYKLTFDLLRRS